MKLGRALSFAAAAAPDKVCGTAFAAGYFPLLLSSQKLGSDTDIKGGHYKPDDLLRRVLGVPRDNCCISPVKMRSENAGSQLDLIRVDLKEIFKVIGCRNKICDILQFGFD